ncbi:MAG: glycosyltransferase [Rhodobacteraceae bacterium]|nr:glycosyltransferase [Paracoccaceae bacterium]
MKIAYDHQIFCIERFGGISHYFTELTPRLAALGHNPKIFAPFHQNHYLAQLPPTVYSGHGFNRFPNKTSRIATHVNRAVSNGIIQRWQPDILHLTYYDWPNLVRKGAPTIVTVHDMNHELQPHLFGRFERLAERKAAAVRNADHVICISQNTKKDMMEILGTPETKISVVHHGVCETAFAYPTIIDQL